MVTAVGRGVTSDPTARGALAQPVRVRGPTDQEGQRLQRIERLLALRDRRRHGGGLHHVVRAVAHMRDLALAS